METIIYMVRHAESPYTEGSERTRGLTPDGKVNADKVTEILRDEGIDIIVSSPYARSILTVEGLARHINLDIKIYEDLRELDLSRENYIIAGMSAIKEMFTAPDYALPGRESNNVCQTRSTAVLNTILEEYRGKAIGTHGIVMTLMMNYFDSNYGFDFLSQTKKPDIYKMQFLGLDLVEVTRLWNG